MCTRETIPRWLGYSVDDMSPVSSPLFVLVEAESALGEGMQRRVTAGKTLSVGPTSQQNL